MRFFSNACVNADWIRGMTNFFFTVKVITMNYCALCLEFSYICIYVYEYIVCGYGFCKRRLALLFHYGAKMVVYSLNELSE